MAKITNTNWYERIPSKGEINDWDVMLNKVSNFNGKSHQWQFRGESYDTLSLSTSVERLVTQLPKSLKGAASIELQLVRDFMRRAQHYYLNLPAENEIVEWLALMQHHGAPTRLLDWTYSFYIALHFAISVQLKKSQKSQNVTIWAVKTPWIRDRVIRILPPMLAKKWKNWHLRKDPEIVLKVLSNHNNFVLGVTPFRMNERISFQQGTFLMPRNVTVPFVENLKEMGTLSELRKNIKMFVINPDNNFRTRVFKNLEAMNISESSLFPGLEGFSRSLNRKAHLYNFDIFKNKDSVVKWMDKGSKAAP